MYGCQAWLAPGERVSDLRSERVEAWLERPEPVLTDADDDV